MQSSYSLDKIKKKPRNLQEDLEQVRRNKKLNKPRRGRVTQVEQE